MQVIQHGVPECDLFVIAPVARPLHLPGDDEVGLFAMPQLDLRHTISNVVTSERHCRFP